MFHQVLAHSPRLNPGPANHQRNMDPFVIQKLLASRMADAVVRHEQQQRILVNALRLQPRNNLPHDGIRHPHGVQIGGPVVQQHGLSRIVRGQRHLLRIGHAPELGKDLLAELLSPSRTAAAQFPARQLDLSKERLPRSAV